jgi:hypothetical protein
MRRGSATDDGRGDEPDAGIGMHDGVEWAKGIEPSYAAWEGYHASANSVTCRSFGSLLMESAGTAKPDGTQNVSV